MLFWSFTNLFLQIFFISRLLRTSLWWYSVSFEWYLPYWHLASFLWDFLHLFRAINAISIVQSRFFLTSPSQPYYQHFDCLGWYELLSTSHWFKLDLYRINFINLIYNLKLKLYLCIWFYKLYYLCGLTISNNCSMYTNILIAFNFQHIFEVYFSNNSMR